MKIYLGSDHGGFNLKNQIKDYLQKKFGENGRDSVLDLGVFTNDSSDYPDMAREVSEKVLENPDSLGILCCGSGVGMCITANRRKGIRAVLAFDEVIAKMSREHNNANVLCLGERYIKTEQAFKVVDAFLDSKFSVEERHVRRVNKIEENWRNEKEKFDKQNRPVDEHHGNC
jgi:ribose 5-phosphate isomerase B